jgi:hypothetical protein
MADGLSTQDLAGRFAFRFSGFSMRNNILYNLVGVGQFEVDPEGKLLGAHRSSLSPLQGQRAQLYAGDYALNGDVSLSDDGVTGYARIFFKDKTEKGNDLHGEFYLAIGGSADRLWLVSSRAEMPHGIPADELVSLEAIRIT